MGFAKHTFVVAPFYYQNLVGALAPQKQANGSFGWVLPLDPDVRCIHMGDISELGNIVAGAFAHPDQAGNGEYLPLVGDFMSFNEIVDTLNRQGHKLSFKQVPGTFVLLPSLVPWRCQRRLATSKFIPTWVRTRMSGLRSQTRWQAGNRPTVRRGLA